MSDEEEQPDKLPEIVLGAAAGITGDVAGFYAGVPGLGAMTGGVVLGMYELRGGRLAQFVSRVVRKVGGEDKLAAVVQDDPGREQILYEAAQAAIATPIEGKRRLLAKVAAEALTGEKPIVDNAALIVTALSELEGQHIAALTRIVAADDRNRRDPGISDENLQDALEEEHPSVLAALVRTGVVLIGSQEVSPGLGSRPRARNYSISGVNEFGRQLLADLQSVEIED